MALVRARPEGASQAAAFLEVSADGSRLLEGGRVLAPHPGVARFTRQSGPEVGSVLGVDVLPPGNYLFAHVSDDGPRSLRLLLRGPRGSLESTGE